MTKLTENQQAVFDCLNGYSPTTIQSVANNLDRKPSDVKKQLEALVKKGLAYSEGDKYGILEAEPNDNPEVETKDSGLGSLFDEGPNAMTEEQEANAIHAQAMDTMPDENEKPPKKKRKAKAEEPKEEPEAKPEPVTYNGFELAEGVEDTSAISDMETDTGTAFENLSNKEKTGLDDYLTIGKFQYSVRPMFKSGVVYGQFLASNFPASASMDAPLRSNATWLYGAVHDSTHEDFPDLIPLLNLDQTKNDRTEALRDYKSANPTVIKRELKKAQKARDKAKEAREAGYINEDGEGDEDEAVKRMEKEAKEKEHQRQEEIMERFNKYVEEGQGDATERFGHMRQAFSTLAKSRKEGIDYMESVLDPVMDED